MTSQSLIFDAVAEAFAAKMVCAAGIAPSGPRPISLSPTGTGATATVELLPGGAGSAQLIVEASL
jgi:hypothetical protein